MHKELLQYYHRSSLKAMLEYLERALSLLPSISTPSSKQSEANWLCKVAWNVALQSHMYHEEMVKFFIMSYEFSIFLPCDELVLSRQQSCQLMAAAAFVHIAKATDVQEEKVGKSCLEL